MNVNLPTKYGGQRYMKEKHNIGKVSDLICKCRYISKCGLIMFWKSHGAGLIFLNLRNYKWYMQAEIITHCRVGETITYTKKGKWRESEVFGYGCERENVNA